LFWEAEAPKTRVTKLELRYQAAGAAGGSTSIREAQL
jgi:hypothetical protein